MHTNTYIYTRTYLHQHLDACPLLLLRHIGAQAEIGVVLQGVQQRLRGDEDVLFLWWVLSERERECACTLPE